MVRAYIQRFLGVVMLLGTSGCVPKDAGFGSVRHIVRERANAEVHWYHGEAVADPEERVRQVLSRPMTAEEAVQVALLNSPELQAAFEEHLEITESHRRQVEELLEAATGSTRAKKCKGMEGLIEEGKEILENEGDADVVDAGLIVAAQKAEHYEIAAYGSLRALASLLGDENAADRFGAILEDERAADEKLTELATGMVNVEAAAAGRG